MNGPSLQAAAKVCLGIRQQTLNRTPFKVRDVPRSDICTAPNSTTIRSPRRPRPSSGSGTVRPSAFAVLRLITNSN
jgi:hypothetical protein